ncbi:unnamed protein product [Effrenium voratum]|uniref:Uncharacterized protein n=1 Tax=Effrenium voratum TaxID=2562239 RepID=A0AA36HKJ6_9DINO|nr:unnamed protein product [Effrenium voratum]
MIGLNRLDAIQLQGPLGLGRTSLAKQHDDLKVVLSQARSDLIAEGVVLPPDEALMAEVHPALSEATHSWLEDPTPSALDLGLLQGAWLEVLAATPPVEAEAAYAFIRWGTRGFEDVLDAIEDLAAREAIDEAYSILRTDLPLLPLVKKMDRLQHELMMLPLLHPQQSRPHRPVYKGPANVSERLQVTREVPQAYENQAAQRQQWLDSGLRVSMAQVNTIYSFSDGGWTANFCDHTLVCWQKKKPRLP